MNRYRVLHYPGDVRADVEAGQLLGHDELGNPYAVIDAEVDLCDNPIPLRSPASDCATCLGTGLVTSVHLNLASEDELRTAIRQRLTGVAAVPTFASFRAAS